MISAKGVRSGVLSIGGSRIATPAFLPVATQGAVPYLGSDDLTSVGCAAMLTNALYLALRPGVDLIERAGGLQRFIGWPGMIVTGSGSFQLRKRQPDTNGPVAATVDESGATMLSHVDGSRLRWRPEDSIHLQCRLGADLTLALTPHTGPDDDAAGLRHKVDRAIRWNARSFAALEKGRALLGVVQGGASVAERQRCAAELAALGAFGYAVGGALGIGAGAHDALAAAIQPLPAQRLRYVLVARSVDDVRRAVMLGADLVSGSFPIQQARRGLFFTEETPIDLTESLFANDRQGPVANCSCPVCSDFSRAYLHHLFRANEMLGPRLAGIHNLFMVQRVMAGLASNPYNP